ncbi:hypothetical protein Tsubulata_019822 [Turnera subulata]|uniref:Peptidase metallopeptidase domain-containing protein n=1 Tax=Turnera subulata TaxID=218843 RepID=A0A9Q0FHP3_9ROSI|nr:hypothetical protein Tsubulata_019822 [Turnera subulata]
MSRGNSNSSNSGGGSHCYHFVFLLLTVSLLSPSASARFFPNVTSIPHDDFLFNATKTAWDAFRNLSGCHHGQTLDGLAKLKQYFNQFGYLPPPPANFTDDFDDSLESAIKTYQHNFNLNVTGQLDPHTLQLIQRPRCGNADIVNGSTSMNSGKAPTPFHTVAHYEFFPGRPRWTKSLLTYAFLPENQLTDDAKGVFTRAFARWSEVIPLTFQQTEDIYAADIRIAFFAGDHGDGEPFDGALGTLGHAFSPPSGRLHLDGDESWVVTGDVTRSSLETAVDLESVAVHEIGHLLGLGHSSVEEAIMFPTLSSRTKKVILASDDIEGVQQLYGSNPNYSGSSSTPSPPTAGQRETSGAPLGGDSTLGLTLLSMFVTVGSVLILL